MAKNTIEFDIHDQLKHTVLINLWDPMQEDVYSHFSAKLWRDIYFSDKVWEKVRYCMLVYDELDIYTNNKIPF